MSNNNAIRRTVKIVKGQKLFIAILFILCATVSCKKHNNGLSLIGEWRVIAISDDQLIGGNSHWGYYPPIDHRIKFNVQSRYEVKDKIISSGGYTGRYRIINDSILAMTYDSHPDPNQEYRFKYSLTTDTLILLNLDFVDVEYKYYKLNGN